MRYCHPWLKKQEINRDRGSKRGIVKILIAEDEFTTRMMVQVCLENWGYRVESVTNGEEAWAKLQKADAPHIAILDWEMPVLRRP